MRKKQRSVYLDYAAATPLDREVRRAMEPWLSEQFANPSGLYRQALEARMAIDKSREAVASFLRTTPDTVIFTNGGTESCNTAIFGITNRQKAVSSTPCHIITTTIEHKAVLEPIRQREKEGCKVDYLPVDADGIVSVEDFKKALRDETVLVSIMYANNEIGSIQPIADIGREILKWRKEKKTVFPYFHTDACQATQFLPMSVEALHVDLLSFNGSKIYGPKGAGVLYKRRDVPLKPLFYGGGQEFGLRSGTEDAPSIVGLGTTVEILKMRDSRLEIKKIQTLRDILWQGIEHSTKDVVLNGPKIFSPYEGGGGGGLKEGKIREGEKRLPNNLNVSFLGTESEALILYLDAAGIAVSSGSACDAGSEDTSYVLKACGYNEARMRSSVRFTLGRETTEEDIEYVLDVLPEIVEKVRKMDVK